MTTVVERSEAPLPLLDALGALARCVVRCAALLVRGELSRPTNHRGERIEFADGSSALIYRETVVKHAATEDPVVLVVGFRLRWRLGSVGHQVFRAESLLNIPLFAGFPGFVSKLWLRHDRNGVYRGFYQWNRGVLAHAYVRALWWVLAIVSERRSITYVVVPGLSRDDVLDNPAIIAARDNPGGTDWWRPTGVFRHAG
jgi:hypothetical protein